MRVIRSNATGLLMYRDNMTQVDLKATEKKILKKRKKIWRIEPRTHGKNICWVVLYLKRYVM